MGDVSHVLPVIHALRERYPDSDIDWVIDPKLQALIPRLPGLRLLGYNKHGGWAAIRALRRQLRPRYDVLLQMQTSLRANLLSMTIRAQRRIGWDRLRQREGHRWCINETINEHPPQHQVQGFLAFARKLDCQVAEPTWPLQIAEADRRWANQMLPDDQPVLGISPCSSHPSRNWHAQGYASVAEHAYARGLQVCLLGGPGQLEQQLGQAIAQHCATPLINLIGRDTPTRMLALLQRCDLVLTPDSGPSHWANALGTPVIALHAATWSRRSGPYNSLHLCVDRFADAARQYRNKPAEQLRWGTRIEHAKMMQLIEIKDVIARLDVQIDARTADHS
ncbi:MAG: glycosyltransferase family 9 protein [Gammaproteobacteria bacterium]|jgi:heptosyltransferase I|nr:glycosyltransferase family 9 protein [Gammaproteobacteria bacterium]